MVRCQCVIFEQKYLLKFPRNEFRKTEPIGKKFRLLSTRQDKFHFKTGFLGLGKSTSAKLTVETITFYLKFLICCQKMSKGLNLFFINFDWNKFTSRLEVQALENLS